MTTPDDLRATRRRPRGLPEGIEAEVIDLRSLSPIDWDTLAAPGGQTGHALFVEEGQVVCGVGAELAFGLRERIPALRVARLGARRAPVSASPC